MQPSNLFRSAAAPLALLLMSAASPAVCAPALIALDIPAGPMARALDVFAAQTHQQLLYTAEIVSGRTVAALKGRYTPDEALQTLLKGSDIAADRAGPTVFVLKRRPSADTALERTAELSSRVPEPVAGTSNQGGASVSAPGETRDTEAPAQEVIVTGTHIRGVAANASPVITINRADMIREGDATVADALVRLPQNFSGQSTPITVANGSDKTGTNGSYSEGVNLRGLGSNATLVLINGRRMAGTGNLGDFADVSAVPSAAVDHVEVLLDGASAIYGSDAVGGVVNIITRKDYDGADSSVRIGDDQGGGGASILATQALGLHWDGGRALFTYEVQHNNRLSASSRPYTANSDLRSLGGSNHDTIYASPGNILALSASFTAYVPVYAIPDGSGLGLTPSSFTPGAVNYHNLWHNADLLPQSDRNGIYLEASQDLDAKTTVDVEGRFNLRHFSDRAGASTGILSVTNKNPYFVSPNGATSELIAYSLDQATGPEINSGDEQNYDFTLGLKRDLWRDWRLEAYAGLAGDVSRVYGRNAINTAHLSEALGTTPDNPATSFSTALDGFYNPYGSGLSNSPALRAFVSDGFIDATNVSLIDTASVQADGSLWSLPAGPVKAAFGAQFRHEHFEPTQYGVTSATPFVSGGTVFKRDVASLFGELNIPLVGPGDALPFATMINLSLAARVEHYDDVGSTTNPKIGLQWKPVSDVTVHATYGTSFRAPNLAELDAPTAYYPASLTAPGKSVLTILEYGGNPALKPESATTWTAGVDWAPKAIHGLRLGATWFSIDFKNEIGAPGTLYTATILSTPALSSLVRLLDPTNPADLAAVTAIQAKPSAATTTLYPAAAFGAIVDARYVNTASKQVSGVDLNGSYTFGWSGYDIGLTTGATYLTTYRQTQVAGSPSQSLLDTAGQPVNFRGRASVTVGRGPYEATVTANYVNRYKDPVAGRAIDSWTTFDATLTWRASARSGPLRGVSLTASVLNIFDADPPFYDSLQGQAYDAANANPFGRMISLQLDKRW